MSQLKVDGGPLSIRCKSNNLHRILHFKLHISKCRMSHSRFVVADVHVNYKTVAPSLLATREDCTRVSVAEFVICTAERPVVGTPQLLITTSRWLQQKQLQCSWQYGQEVLWPAYEICGTNNATFDEIRIKWECNNLLSNQNDDRAAKMQCLIFSAGRLMNLCISIQTFSQKC